MCIIVLKKLLRLSVFSVCSWCSHWKQIQGLFYFFPIFSGHLLIAFCVCEYGMARVACSKFMLPDMLRAFLLTLLICHLHRIIIKPICMSVCCGRCIRPGGVLSTLIRQQTELHGHFGCFRFVRSFFFVFYKPPLKILLTHFLYCAFIISQSFASVSLLVLLLNWDTRVKCS